MRHTSTTRFFRPTMKCFCQQSVCPEKLTEPHLALQFFLLFTPNHWSVRSYAIPGEKLSSYFSVESFNILAPSKSVSRMYGPYKRLCKSNRKNIHELKLILIKDVPWIFTFESDSGIKIRAEVARIRVRCPDPANNGLDPDSFFLSLWFFFQFWCLWPLKQRCKTKAKAKAKVISNPDLFSLT